MGRLLLQPVQTTLAGVTIIAVITWYVGHAHFVRTHNSYRHFFNAHILDKIIVIHVNQPFNFNGIILFDNLSKLIYTEI
jgi:hypothetical protein